MLKGHVRLRLETNAGTEDVGQASALLGKGVDHGGTGRGQRCLEHVAEYAENAVEVLVLGGGGAIGGSGLPLDTGHHLGNDDKIDNQRRSQQGVLADVEQTVKFVST